MRRYTFVIHVHPDGLTTLENLATQQQVQISDLDTVGPQIGRWLNRPPKPSSASGAPRLTSQEKKGT